MKVIQPKMKVSKISRNLFFISQDHLKMTPPKTRRYISEPRGSRFTVFIPLEALDPLGYHTYVSILSSPTLTPAQACGGAGEAREDRSEAEGQAPRLSLSAASYATETATPSRSLWHSTHSSIPSRNVPIRGANVRRFRTYKVS